MVVLHMTSTKDKFVPIRVLSQLSGKIYRTISGNKEEVEKDKSGKTMHDVPLAL